MTELNIKTIETLIKGIAAARAELVLINIKGENQPEREFELCRAIDELKSSLVDVMQKSLK